MMMSDKTLAVGDNHFAYRTCGSGPDVLLIHGWLSSGRMWQALMEHLAPHHRLWAIDLMGFGDSRASDPTRILTLDDQARLTVAFCKAAGIRPQAVVGHSMGGAVSIKLALNFPELFDKLILVCPVVTGNLGRNVNLLLASPMGKTMLNFAQYVWPHMMQIPQVSVLVAPAYLAREAAIRSFEDFKKATWTAAYGGLLSMVDIRLDLDLPRIDKPTLVVCGAHDLTVPPADSRIAARLIPGAQFVELPDCHHQVPDEDPDAFHNAIGEFLGVGAARSAYAA